MPKSRLIVFVGPVGSGKSTHMKLLYLELKRKGLKVKTGFLKTGHLFAFILEVFIAKILTGKRRNVSPIRALIEKKPHLFKRIFGLWLILDLVSITMKFLISIYIPLRLGYTLIVEEYIPAIISDYIYLSRLVEFPLKINSFAIRYMLKLMSLCNPTQVVFLDAKVNELSQRWKRRKSPDERDDYIRMQRTLLLQLSKSLSSRFLYVNTETKTIMETHKLIISYLLLLNDE